MKISETLRELMSMKPAQQQQIQQQSTTAASSVVDRSKGNSSGSSSNNGTKTRNKKLPIWSDSAERAVIEFFRERPFLWDQKAVDYYNKERKDAALAELATKLGVRYTVSAIRERWSNMRCTFMVNERKIARAKTGNGHLSNFIPTWPHYNDLKFLQNTHPKCLKSANGRKKFLEDADQLSKQRSRKQKILDSFQDELEYYYTTTDSDVESVSGSSLNPAVISTTTPSGATSNTDASWIKVENGSVGSDSPPPAPEYHMYESQYPNDRNHLLSESIEVFKEFVHNSVTNQDSCHSFGVVVAAALRDMPSYHRACAQLEIQQVLLKYNPENPENLSKTDAMDHE